MVTVERTDMRVLLNSWITQVGRWTAEFSFKKNKDGQSIVTGMYI